MTTIDKIGDEKLQFNIEKEAAKISLLSSCKIDKYEFLTGEEILSSDPGLHKLHAWLQPCT